MAETKWIPAYRYLGTLTDTLGLTVQVARDPEGGGLLLVNRIAHSPETRGLFCELYASFVRRPERSDLLRVFSVNQDFFAVFRYAEGPSLAGLYEGCPGPAARRLELLIRALFQAYSGARDLPEAVLCSVLQPENLLLDGEGNIRLRYALEARFLPEEGGGVWDEAAALMEFLLGRELKSPYHKALRAIHKKCLAGLYPSLPAMINDLEKAADTLAQAGPIQAAKAFFQRQKGRIVQLSWLGMVTLLVCLVVYAITSLTDRQAADVVPISAIGNVTYVAAQDEDENSLQLTDPAADGGEDGVDFTSLPEQGAALTSEDYIVQPGDSLASICAGYYGAAGYDALVAAFNGLEPEQRLDAGSVLLLPLRDQLAPYMEN